MKKWILNLVIAALLSGCKTAPDAPKPDTEKYTFWVISIEVPVDVALSSGPDVDGLIHHPDAKIVEYPLVIAGLGESVTNDQTQTVLLPEDFNVIDGKLVAVEKECKLGYWVAIAVNEIKNGAVSYQLTADYTELIGYDSYEVGDGLVAKMPYMDRRSVDTELTQKPDTWVTMGGLVDEKPNGKRMSFMMAVKLISPAEEQ